MVSNLHYIRFDIKSGLRLSHNGPEALCRHPAGIQIRPFEKSDANSASQSRVESKL